MPIPEFFYFIRPALELHQDGKVLSVQHIEDALAIQFGIEAKEREELLPSGRSTRLYSRVQWATTYLRQAKLLESTGRGLNRITDRGLTYLRSCPPVIKPVDLTQFPEFVAFQRKNAYVVNGTATKDQPQPVVPVMPERDIATPEEIIDTSYKTLRDALAQELLERMKAMPPAFFERLIVQLMLSLGYGGAFEEAGQALGKSGDGGVDGVINQDKLGLDKIYLQAKRWSNGSVGSNEVQAFVGALSGRGAVKGVFITTSTFTKAAMEYVKNNHSFKISLIDGDELARMMIDHNLGVSLVQRYEIKRIDSDFFTADRNG